MRTVAVLALAAALVVAGCAGSAAPTAAPVTPSATPGGTPFVSAAPLPSPAHGLPSSPDPTSNGGFAYPANDLLAYYEGLGFGCTDAEASTQARDYTLRRCFLVDATAGLTYVFGLVTDAKGVPGDSFEGVVTTYGKGSPGRQNAETPLVAFLGTVLGSTAGTEAATWLVQQLGIKSTPRKVGDMTVATFTTSDAQTGSGYWAEVANGAFLDAPTP